MKRREMIKSTAAAIIALPQPQPAAKTAPTRKAHRFFTAAEFALVDELSELIIPTDAHSPGARAAKVASYIDQRLGESRDEEPRTQWRAGLKLIDAISREMNGKTFMRSTPDQRIALLQRISKNETDPQKPEEKFFVELKSKTAKAYYTSKIGLRQELEYKGNSYLREFAGEDVS